MMHITDKEPDIFDGHENKKKQVVLQLTICYKKKENRTIEWRISFYIILKKPSI